jgi:hypothetical protein
MNMASVLDPQFLKSYTNANVTDNAFGKTFIKDMFGLAGLSKEAVEVILAAIKSAPSTLFSTSTPSYADAAAYQTALVTSTNNAASFTCDKVFADSASLNAVYIPLKAAVDVYNGLPILTDTDDGPIDNGNPVALILAFPTNYCTNTGTEAAKTYFPETDLQSALNTTFAKITTSGIADKVTTYNTAWANICKEFNTGATNAVADIVAAQTGLSTVITDLQAALVAPATNTVWTSIRSEFPVIDGCAPAVTFNTALGNTIVPGTIITTTFKAIPTNINADFINSPYCTDYEYDAASYDVCDLYNV